MFKNLDITKVHANPDQPRKDFEPKALHELAASIKQNGLIQPILVRPMPDKTFQIIAGERRYRAHLLLSKKTIGAHVKRTSSRKMAIQAIIENLQRSDIKPMEEARAFQAILDTGVTVSNLAKDLGLSQPWRIGHRTSLLKLDDRYQSLVDAGSITINAAFEIAKLSPSEQTRVIQMINRGVVKTDQQVSTLVQTILDKINQNDFFGDSNKASPKDVRTINSMELKIQQISTLAAAGWKDGQCVTASKVSPDRAALMAKKISEIRKQLGHMERDLQNAQVQAELLCA